MLLIFIKKETSRLSYTFKHICQRILGLEIAFTTSLEEFISFPGAKISYGTKPLGNELFFQSAGLLEQQGIEDPEISVKEWEETVGFFAVSAQSALPFDIFSSSFFLLSRYEEYLPQVKDELGRFMASESLAYRFDFLHQPVVDIWAFKFKERLLEAFPDLIFSERKTSIHPIIEASQPFTYKQQGLLRSVVGIANDLFRGRLKKIRERILVLLKFLRDPGDTHKWIINTALHSSFKIIFFFLLGNGPSFSETRNSHRERFRLLLKYVADYKEVGLIFSFESLSNYEMLKKEKRRIENITNRSLESSMNAEMLVKLPEIYRLLLELEVSNDYTMGYPNYTGFRAGTCTPFLFYDLDFEIKTPLLIHPLSGSAKALRNKSLEEQEILAESMLLEVEKVKGNFIWLFSNLDFSSTPKNQFWRKFFSDRLSKYNSEV